MNRILRCFRPEDTDEKSSNTVTSSFVVRAVRSEGENGARFSTDDPDLDTAELRKTIGPGFQFMSDLHYERFFDKTTNLYNHPQIPRRAPYLILAGDIGRFCDGRALESALRPACDRFEKVLFVPGNHEFYGTSRAEGIRIADDLDSELGNKFAFMNRRRVDLEGVIILGCTLQSHIPEGVHLTNDFEMIKGWSVAEHNAEHETDVQWLKQSLCDISKSQPKMRVIIATHYAPAFKETTHPRLQESKYRYCFGSDTLEEFKMWEGANQVSHWIFGHTHYNTVFAFGETLVVSNTPNDNDCRRKFDPEATV